MTFQLGVYSFGNTPLVDGEGLGPTSQAIRNVMETIRLAEQVGLDFFGVGEHHRHIMPISSPASVINAAAAVTTRIGPGSTVIVLSTDDPVRVYQQHAMAAALAPGRVEITVGRGSGTDSYPLYSYRLEDRDSLFAAKLDLLLAVNAAERVTWDGPHRAQPLRDALVVPRADPPMKIRLGSGGSPESSIRAGDLGLPIAYGILNFSTNSATVDRSCRWTAAGSPTGKYFAPSNCWAPRLSGKYGPNWDEHRLTRDPPVGRGSVPVGSGRRLAVQADHRAALILIGNDQIA
jgi:alkanesulfonate monooxygenase SsuD/methylene tetrahydromethanopterin reductase-like flavin-dependent oxidoreductase (luciferase family)